MPQYRVHLTWTRFAYVLVDAAGSGEAADRAGQEIPCDGDHGVLHIEDIDGTMEVCCVEEVQRDDR